jgi:hypothetical protein
MSRSLSAEGLVAKKNHAAECFSGYPHLCRKNRTNKIVRHLFRDVRAFCIKEDEHVQ